MLPLFLTTTLGATPAIVGIIEGVAEGVAAFGKAASGRLADLRRRRPLVATGYGLASLAKLLLAAAFGWPLVLAARVLDRLGKGIRGAPRDALIADSVPPSTRGAAFGFHRAADTAGAVVGPLLGLALYEALGHELRPLLFVAVLPAVISTALVFLVREPPHPAPISRKRLPLRPATPLGAAYWRVTIVLTLFACVNFSDALLLLRANELGLGFAAVIGVYTLYNVVYAALSYPAGAISDRIPRRTVFATGLAVFAFAYIGLGVARTGAWVWLLLPVYGAYPALTDGVTKAWIVDCTPARDVATGLGLYQALTGIGAVVAGVWAALTWSHDGTLPLLVAGSVTAALVAVLGLAGRTLDAAQTPTTGNT